MENKQLMELIGSALSTAMESVNTQLEQTQERINELEAEIKKLQSETEETDKKEPTEMSDEEIDEALRAII